MIFLYILCFVTESHSFSQIIYDAALQTASFWIASKETDDRWPVSVVPSAFPWSWSRWFEGRWQGVVQSFLSDFCKWFLFWWCFWMIFHDLNVLRYGWCCDFWLIFLGDLFIRHLFVLLSAFFLGQWLFRCLKLHPRLSGDRLRGRARLEPLYAWI